MTEVFEQEEEDFDFKDPEITDLPDLELTQLEEPTKGKDLEEEDECPKLLTRRNDESSS